MDYFVITSDDYSDELIHRIQGHFFCRRPLAVSFIISVIKCADVLRQHFVGKKTAYRSITLGEGFAIDWNPSAVVVFLPSNR
jgi:hypothetical protein